MDQISIISQLGSDAELLTKSDEYLTGQQLMLCQRLSLVAAELKRLMLVISIKRQLQQTNCVAVKHLDRLPGNIVDEALEIMELPDAVKAILDEPENILNDSHFNQLFIWSNDGYDVPAAIPE